MKNVGKRSSTLILLNLKTYSWTTISMPKFLFLDCLSSLTEIQTQVMTTMRGTPRYLAPEWLSSVITEKVDVYSFGIVFLEILCGRKNFDISEAEESRHLLHVFQRCWEKEMLIHIVKIYKKMVQRSWRWWKSLHGVYRPILREDLQYHQLLSVKKEEWMLKRTWTTTTPKSYFT